MLIFIKSKSSDKSDKDQCTIESSIMISSYWLFWGETQLILVVVDVVVVVPVNSSKEAMRREGGKN